MEEHEFIEYDANIGQDQLAILREESKRVQFSSDLPFLRTQNGWRKGKLHIVLGTSHGGKSTWLRTCIVDALSSNNGSLRVGLILSEESKLDFLTEFDRSGKLEPLLDRLFIASEEDYKEKFNTPKNWFNQAKFLCVENDIDILFFDNLTTADIYEAQTIAQQKQVSSGLKRMASALDIPVIVVAHTAGNVTENYDKLINMNDIRYSKNIVNLAQFFYIMQTFYQGAHQFTTLRIVKHRGQDVQYKFFQLIYSEEMRMFRDCQIIDFEKIKELFKKRNKL